MEAKQQELEYYIYITTNMLNGMQYLGQHTHKVGTKDSYLGSGKYFLRALKKDKKENFHKEILYYAFDENELNEIEVWYIKHLNAVEDPMFYNLHCGGNVQHGKNNSAYGKCDKSVKCMETNTIYKSMINAAKELKISSSNISMVVGSNNKSGGYTWELVKESSSKKNHSLCQKVLCITSGITYDSALEASKLLNIDRSAICKVCKGIRKSVGGLEFIYLDSKNRESTSSKKIICENDSKIFNSITEASKFYNISLCTIEYILKGKKTRTNLKFKLTN